MRITFDLDPVYLSKPEGDAVISEFLAKGIKHITEEVVRMAREFPMGIRVSFLGAIETTVTLSSEKTT